MKLLKTLVAAVALSAAALASPVGDACSSLAVSVTDEGETQALTFDVNGSSALSFHILVVGRTAGAVDLPQLGFTLGIQPPLIAVPLGISSPMGDLSASFDAPTGLGTFFGQAIGLTVGGGAPSACESNVVEFTL